MSLLRLGSCITYEGDHISRHAGKNSTYEVTLRNTVTGVPVMMVSARNVADVTLCPIDQMTCFEMLNHRYLVIGKSELESWLSGPSSQTGKDARLSPMGRQEKKAQRPAVKRGAKARGGAE